MQVLNTYVSSQRGFSFLLALILGIFLMCLTILLREDITQFVQWHFHGVIYKNAKHVWKVMFGVIAVVAIVGMITSCETKMYAEATIIDSYPVGALYSKYDVVERRGDIWVLEIRETVDEEVTTGQN